MNYNFCSSTIINDLSELLNSELFDHKVNVRELYSSMIQNFELVSDEALFNPINKEQTKFSDFLKSKQVLTNCGIDYLSFLATIPRQKPRL